jgi:hypothetical protein
MCSVKKTEKEIELEQELKDTKKKLSASKRRATTAENKLKQTENVEKSTKKENTEMSENENKNPEASSTSSVEDKKNIVETIKKNPTLLKLIALIILVFAGYKYFQQVQAGEMDSEDSTTEEHVVLTGLQKFHVSKPGTVHISVQDQGILTRIKTDHGSYNKVSGAPAPQITFRPSGPMGYLFPTYTGNPRRVELGFVADENYYAPSIQVPEKYRNYIWVHITDPDMAGAHAQAVVDTGMVWALVAPPEDPDTE